MTCAEVPHRLSGPLDAAVAGADYVGACAVAALRVQLWKVVVTCDLSRGRLWRLSVFIPSALNC